MDWPVALLENNIWLSTLKQDLHPPKYNMDTNKMVWKHLNMLGYGIYVWYVKKIRRVGFFSHYKNDQQTLWMGQTRFESTAAKTQQVAVERPANQSLQWHQQNGLWRNGTKMYHACLRAGSKVILVHFWKDLIMFDLSLLVTAGALLLSSSLLSAC